MAKRERRGSSSPKSNARGANKPSGAPPAQSDRSDGDDRIRPPPPTPEPGLAASGMPQQSVDSRAPAALLQSDPTAAPPQQLGMGRRIRTPAPRPIPGDLEEITLGLARAQKAQLGKPSDAAGAPTKRLGAGNRNRTPTPGELEEAGPPRDIHVEMGRAQRGGLGRFQALLQNSAVLEALISNLQAKKPEEKAGQFRHIQDLVHNPSLLDLRSKEVGTSSTPEEIEARKGEVRYQIQVMRSMLAVLTEELDQLEQARPQLSAD